MPDISVLMPVYNVRSYPPGWFMRAVESVSDCELCIVDDCSTDDTFELLQTVPGAKVGRTKRNSGGVDAVNIAAGMATGRYFILLSCRSWYEPGSLETLARYLNEHPDIGFVYGCTQFHNPERYKKPIPFRDKDFRKAFVSSFGYLYRREAWDAGCRYDCTIWLNEEQRYMTIADYHMAMNLIFKMKWQGYVLSDQLVLHYERGGAPQMGDLLAKHKKEMNQEFSRLWNTA